MPEITIAERIAMLQIAVVNRARNIYEYLETLESMEKSMKLQAKELELFRLCVRSIKADVTSLAAQGERISHG